MLVPGPIIGKISLERTLPKIGVSSVSLETCGYMELRIYLIEIEFLRYEKVDK